MGIRMSLTSICYSSVSNHKTPLADCLSDGGNQGGNSIKAYKIAVESDRLDGVRLSEREHASTHANVRYVYAITVASSRPSSLLYCCP